MTDGKIDWESLAIAVGSYDPESGNQHGGTNYAKDAITRLLGEGALQAAVDFYVDSPTRGTELARSVLWLLHPVVAMERCLDIYTTDNNIQRRRSAVELLRVVDDGRNVERVRDFLADPDVEIQAWGAGLLDQLLWSELVSEDDVEALIELAESHGNEAVRERATFIRSFLADRRDTP